MITLDRLHRQDQKLVLSDQLTDLHIFVQLEAAVPVSQHAVEQLIKVDPAILSFDVHLKQALLYLTFTLAHETEWRWYRFDEIEEELAFELDAVMFLCHLNPFVFDNGEVFVE